MRYIIASLFISLVCFYFYAPGYCLGLFSGILLVLAVQVIGAIYFWSLVKKKKKRKVEIDNASESFTRLDAFNRKEVSVSDSDEFIVWITPRINKIVAEGKKSSRKDLGRETENSSFDSNIDPEKFLAFIEGTKLLLKKNNVIDAVIDLDGCEIKAISANGMPERKWNRRFPIRIRHSYKSLFRDSREFYIYFMSGYEKEKWCGNFLLVSMLKSKPDKNVFYMKDEFLNYIKYIKETYTSQIDDLGKNDRQEAYRSTNSELNAKKEAEKGYFAKKFERLRNSDKEGKLVEEKYENEGKRSRVYQSLLRRGRNNKEDMQKGVKSRNCIVIGRLDRRGATRHFASSSDDDDKLEKKYKDNCEELALNQRRTKRVNSDESIESCQTNLNSTNVDFDEDLDVAEPELEIFDSLTTEMDSRDGREREEATREEENDNDDEKMHDNENKIEETESERREKAKKRFNGGKEETIDGDKEKLIESDDEFDKSKQMDDSKIHFSEVKEVDRGLTWVNCFITRIFFDLCRNQNFKNLLKTKMQKKLDAINRPAYVGPITCEYFDAGKYPFLAKSMTIHAIGPNGEISLDIDLEYFGKAKFIVKTRIDNQGEKEAKEKAEKEEMFDEKGNSIGKERKSIFYRGLRAVVSHVVDQVSQVPLSLEFTIHSMSGKCRLRIGSPPVNRLWFGFLGMPNLDIESHPSIGELTIKRNMISTWMDEKIKGIIKENFVFPQSSDISLSFMLSNADDFVKGESNYVPWESRELSSNSVSTSQTKLKDQNIPSMRKISSTTSISVASDDMISTNASFASPSINASLHRSNIIRLRGDHNGGKTMGNESIITTEVDDCSNSVIHNVKSDSDLLNRETVRTVILNSLPSLQYSQGQAFAGNNDFKCSPVKSKLKFSASESSVLQPSSEKSKSIGDSKVFISDSTRKAANEKVHGNDNRTKGEGNAEMSQCYHDRNDQDDAEETSEVEENEKERAVDTSDTIDISSPTKAHNFSASKRRCDDFESSKGMPSSHSHGPTVCEIDNVKEIEKQSIETMTDNMEGETNECELSRSASASSPFLSSKNDGENQSISESKKYFSSPLNQYAEAGEEKEARIFRREKSFSGPLMPTERNELLPTGQSNDSGHRNFLQSLSGRFKFSLPRSEARLIDDYTDEGGVSEIRSNYVDFENIGNGLPQNLSPTTDSSSGNSNHHFGSPDLEQKRGFRNWYGRVGSRSAKDSFAENVNNAVNSDDATNASASSHIKLGIESVSHRFMEKIRDGKSFAERKHAPVSLFHRKVSNKQNKPEEENSHPQKGLRARWSSRHDH